MAEKENSGSPTVGKDTLTQFTDRSQISNWANDAIAWAVSNNIMVGKGENMLDAKGNATRAEVASMLQRFIEAMSHQ